MQKHALASVGKLHASSQAPELQVGATPGEPGLLRSVVSDPLVLGTGGRLISFEQSSTDGRRCFGSDAMLANQKAFPKLSALKSMMLTLVSVCAVVLINFGLSLTTVGVASSGAAHF